LIDFRPILLILGTLISVLGFILFLPAAIDFANNQQNWRDFTNCALISLFMGISLVLANKSVLNKASEIQTLKMNISQAFILTTLTWLFIAIFGSLPFVLTDLNLSFTDAFFESMSGVTTTGSTIIADLNNVSKGLLFWRSTLQWIGGIGIIVIAISVLPLLQVGGMQLFRMESSDTSEKVLPRTAQIAGGISAIYFLLTLVCAISLWVSGMTAFDAICHSMTTIATGGFSTVNGSIGHFDNPSIDCTIMIFMLLSSLPFVLYLQALQGNNFGIIRDTQVKTFLIFVLISVFALTIWNLLHTQKDFLDALRLSSFNAISIITGTGYTTTDFDNWGSFPLILFLFLMITGGCAGSTTCGVKIFRLQILYVTALKQIKQLMHPRGIFIAYYNRKQIPPNVAESVMGFFFIFIISLLTLTLCLSYIGLDFLTSISAAATAIANVGPGLGNIIGPEGNFSGLPEIAKWLLSFGMLIGRLEFYTVLVLFLPSFWKD
jgi:trk system potassium uptake protein TrkH